MMDPPISGNRGYLSKVLSAVALLASFSLGTPATTHISGTVRNMSRNQPAAGDEVLLLRLDHGVERETHTKTGSQGAFVLHVRYPAKSYVVRVIHEGVTYDRRASAGDVLSVEVFDAALRVSGITSTIEILRADTNGNLLHVSDLYELKNDSNPPLTQAGDRSFEVYLPKNAKLDSAFAAGPEKIGSLIAADPVPDEPGHYTVNFPLRPGETKFSFNYDLPYQGSASFQTKRAYALRQLAVMIPPTMNFSSRSSAFQLLTTGRSDYQVQTASLLSAGEGPGFEVSGTGALPPLGNHTHSFAPLQPAPSRSTSPTPSLSRARALREAQPPSQSVLMFGLTAVFLTACAFFVWRARRAHRTPVAKTAATCDNS
jgi:hypothetical protein